MMGLLTTLSLVGSLVLWAGYQAFYVPTNETDPLPDQKSIDDIINGQNNPQRAFGRARFRPQGGYSTLSQADTISRTTTVSFLSGKSEIDPISAFLTSSTKSPYSIFPFSALLTTKDAKTKDYFVGKMLKDYESQAKSITQTGEDLIPNNSLSITSSSSMVNQTLVSDNTTSEITNSSTTGEDYIHNTTELDQLITTEDNHTLSSDNNVLDHNTTDENLSRVLTDLPVQNISLHKAKMVNQSVSSLDILYTLVTFVKNLESQDRGNFSKTFDNLVYSNESKINISKSSDKPTVEDLAKSLLNSSQETEPNVTEGFGETKNFLHNKLGITPAERIASEDAKVLSKEYMDHFGWQGYLLIFFIIIIVLLLITSLILFASSYFTWRNKRKQTKPTKTSNSHKEA